MVQHNMSTAMETPAMEWIGIYGHSINEKELRKVTSSWYSFMMKLLKGTLHTKKATFFKSGPDLWRLLESCTK